MSRSRSPGCLPSRRSGGSETPSRSHPRFRAGLTLLVNVSGLIASSVSETDLAELGARIIERDWNARPLAVAIVASDPEIKAAREYRAVLEARSRTARWCVPEPKRSHGLKNRSAHI